ncbi:MAG: NTP transferase domain-containing protein, partial [Alphaproteobacteria bacterium]|nr:NTP transferase domain-containing protein [Alphaproteobacteria bacterium]
SLGLKSVPDFCDGAVVIPADMPNITSADINKLISSFDKGKEKQVCMFSYKGVRSNPIVWSKELYAKADIVPENAHLRPVFMEHADYTNLVDIKDANKLLDVNFPSDVEKIIKYKKKQSS